MSRAEQANESGVAAETKAEKKLPAMKRLGLRLVRYREAAPARSQEAIARSANISTRHYQKLEHGRVPAPSVPTLLALAQALEIDPGQLITGIPPDPEP